jgi:hypothetical protein
MGRLEEMNWIRNQSWLVLMAMLFLAAATIVFAGGQAAATDPIFPAHPAYLAAVPLGHGDTGPTADSHHGSAPVDDAHGTGTFSSLPCDAACPVGSVGCEPAPLASHTGILQRDVRMVCIRSADDLMLTGPTPDARLKPPRLIA